VSSNEGYLYAMEKWDLAKNKVPVFTRSEIIYMGEIYDLNSERDRKEILLVEQMNVKLGGHFVFPDGWKPLESWARQIGLQSETVGKAVLDSRQEDTQRGLKKLKEASNGH